MVHREIIGTRGRELSSEGDITCNITVMFE